MTFTYAGPSPTPYAGQTFRIVFYHRHEPDEKWPRRCHPILTCEVKREHGIMVRAITYCYIERLLDGKWENSSRLGGAACCSLDDNFSRETGRKLSLDRCLQPCDERFKKAAWSVYLNRPRPKREKLPEGLPYK
jgi:hypothetical protein